MSGPEPSVLTIGTKSSWPSLVRISMLWLAVRLQVSTHNLQPPPLLVSTRYHHGLSLVEWFGNPSLLGLRFHNRSLMWMKRGHLDSRGEWFMSSNLHALAGYLVHNYLKQIFHHMCHSWWMQFEHALKFLNYFTKNKKEKKLNSC